MKKLTSLALMLAAAVLVVSAINGAASDASSDSKAESTKSEEKCCQDNAADATKLATKTGCPLCATEKPGKSQCSDEQCADTGEKSNDLKASLTSNVAAPALCPAGEGTCSDKEESQCGDKCPEGTVTQLAATSKSGAPQCKDCSDARHDATGKGVQTCKECSEEDCKEECESCAASRKEETEAETHDVAATHGVAAKMGRHQGRGHGHAGDSQHEKDHQDFFFLIEHRDSIRRTVKNLPNGIETLTESDEGDVASTIQEHVEAMYDRMENVNPIRMRDPLFREIFSNTDKIEMNVQHTDHGVRVTETSDDAYVVKLLQEHAKVVSLFIKNGYAELPKNHTPPKK